MHIRHSYFHVKKFYNFQAKLSNCKIAIFRFITRKEFYHPEQLLPLNDAT